MSENKFNIECKVKGAKIKSKIEGYIETTEPEMAQGQQDFKIRVVFDFEEGDIPSKIIINAEVPDGFEKAGTLEFSPTEKHMELEIPVVYTNAPVGFYTIEGFLIHDEFGTELGNLEASYFNLKIPELKIRSCTIEPKVVKRGDKFQVSAVLYSSAPQKIKGTLTGKLKPAGDQVNAKVYELEPQKIGVKDEKGISWTMMIPRDEEGIADYSATFKFETKDAKTEANFENVMELKRERDLEVLILGSDAEEVSGGDNVKINSIIKNTGIEAAKIDLVLNITYPDGSSQELPRKEVQLEPGSETNQDWDWEVPGGLTHGHYQFNIIWTISGTGETRTIPGSTVEIKPIHQIEVQSVSTDRDYYLSGQDVLLTMLLRDNGTRSGIRPIAIKYSIRSGKTAELFEGRKEEKIQQTGTEIKIKWSIPPNLPSGALDFQMSAIDGNMELIGKTYKKLINIEQPIQVKFEIIKSKIKGDKNIYSKFMLEGESIVDEESYSGLKIIHLSSNTNIMTFKNNVIGGIDWEEQDADERRHAEDLFFSYLMLKNGINLDNLRDLKKHWNEMGRLWTTKLVIMGKDLKRSVVDDKSRVGKSKNPLYTEAFMLNHPVLKRLKKQLTASPASVNDWKQVAKPIIAPVNFKDYKELESVFKHTFSENIGKSVLEVIIPYLEIGTIKDTGRLASAMKNVIGTLNSVVSKVHMKKDESILNSLNHWLSIFKDAKIEVDNDDEIAILLDMMYNVVTVKLINRIIETIDEILSSGQVTRRQYVKLSFSLICYHMLNIEHHQNSIKFNRFINEDIRAGERMRHFNEIEKLSSELESILTQVMKLYRNHMENMKLRSNSVLMFEKVKFIKESNLMNGLMGEQIKQKLLFQNSSPEDLNFKILLAFPSLDWHLLAPESNLNDGIYWNDKFSIPSHSKRSFNVTVAFPKTLSLREYKCLVKLEPQNLKLLDEN